VFTIIDHEVLFISRQLLIVMGFINLTIWRSHIGSINVITIFIYYTALEKSSRSTEAMIYHAVYMSIAFLTFPWLCGFRYINVVYNTLILLFFIPWISRRLFIRIDHVVPSHTVLQPSIPLSFYPHLLLIISLCPVPFCFPIFYLSHFLCIVLP
jgi:hypothetical protein